MRLSVDVGRWHLVVSRDRTGPTPETDHGAGEPLDALVEFGSPDPHRLSELDARHPVGFGNQ